LPRPPRWPPPDLLGFVPRLPLSLPGFLPCPVWLLLGFVPRSPLGFLLCSMRWSPLGLVSRSTR
jgi:hypothetical protein